MKLIPLKKIVTILLFSLALTGHCQNIDYRGFPEWSFGKEDSTEYYLYTPQSAGKGKALPLVLFLHGCCGTDYHATLRNAVDPPVRLWHNFGDNTQANPIYILSAKTSRGWRQHFPNLKAAIDNLIAKNLVDPQRIYISGFSMGSAGTWQFIEAYPDYFAAAITMGMDFTGKNYSNFRDVPVWAIRGDQDWWARHLGTQIKSIRALNVKSSDSLEWHTGVNPRLTNFEGMGHGVMWAAVNELPLSDWLLSKVNDGNKYPMVYFHAPSYMQAYKEGEVVNLNVEAFDPDGRIEKSVFTANGKIVAEYNGVPKQMSFLAKKGDNVFSVTVSDDQGKTATETGSIRVDIPSTIVAATTPSAKVAKYFSHQLSATGNGKLRWSVQAGQRMPEGLLISNDGKITGVPVTDGTQTVKVLVTDEDGDTDEETIHLAIEKQSPSDVLVTGVKNHRGTSLPVAEVRKGITPHIRGDNEVSFSSIPSNYEGLLFIQTEPNDTTMVGSHYLEFSVDQPVTVYVAYEKMTNLFKSTTPSWLQEFRREKDEIIAQYYYYDVFSKDFPAGRITLPHSMERASGVNTNYFVLIRKR